MKKLKASKSKQRTDCLIITVALAHEYIGTQKN